MFHKASGKVFFYVVTLMFFVLSVQNTWAFLAKTLPGADPKFLVCMMIVFEGGFLGWLAMLMGGAENVWRVGIAFIMLLVTGAGVFTGAYFEIGGMMHTGIGYKVDPAILAWVPTSVLIAYISTGMACVLYMLASPEFFYRMSHMNATGQAPAIGSHIEMLPPRHVELAQHHPAGQRALPSPKQATQSGPLLVEGGSLRNRFGNWLARVAGGLQREYQPNPLWEAENQAGLSAWAAHKAEMDASNPTVKDAAPSTPTDEEPVAATPKKKAGRPRVKK